jgi:hypothetical protein
VEVRPALHQCLEQHCLLMRAAERQGVWYLPAAAVCSEAQVLLAVGLKLEVARPAACLLQLQMQLGAF